MTNKIKKTSNFYLDIFNKLLSINEHKIFIVFDKNENIWFCLRDLLLALGYKDTKDAIRSLDIDDEFTINIGKLLVGGTHLYFSLNLFCNIEILIFILIQLLSHITAKLYPISFMSCSFFCVIAYNSPNVFLFTLLISFSS